MADDLVSHLFKDKIAEFERRDAAWRQAVQWAIEDLIAVRFPDLPIGIALKTRQLDQPDQFQRLRQGVLRATTAADVAHLLDVIVTEGLLRD